MNTEELSKLAWETKQAPDGLTFSELFCFHMLRALFGELKQGVISKAQAEKERSAIAQAYKAIALQERIYKQHTERNNEIAILSSKINSDGCPLCKQMYDIYSGFSRKENNA